MSIQWDGTITAGSLLTCITLLISVFAAYNRITIELRELRTKVDMIYNWWVSQNEANLQVAKKKFREI